MTLRRSTSAAAIGSFALLLLAGCGDKVAEDTAKLNKSNIQRLANLYSGFQNGFAKTDGKQGSGPKDEAEFKAYINGYPADKLKNMGVDTSKMDALFASERDGKPFKIRYGVGGGRGSVDPVIFEQEGKEGKKQVGFTGAGRVDDVDDAQYKELLAGKGGTPAAPPGGAPPAAGSGRPAGGPPPGAPTGPPGGGPGR